MKRRDIIDAEYLYKTPTQSIRIIARDCDEAEEKLNRFYNNKVENEGLWGYEIDKGPTDRYEDSADVRLITPKDY